MNDHCYDNRSLNSAHCKVEPKDMDQVEKVPETCTTKLRKDDVNSHLQQFDVRGDIDDLTNEMTRLTAAQDGLN